MKRKLCSILLLGVLVCLSFSGCGEPKDLVKIGVIQISEHPSLNTIRDSFTAQMAELGYQDGKNCSIEYKDAGNESSTANSIIQSFKGDEKDVIVAIATPTALAAATVSDTIPVVFSAVTDPVHEGLVDSLESPGRNITGTSDALEIGKILDLAFTLTPDIETLGYLYNAGEPNSVSCLEKVKEYLAQTHPDVVLTEMTVANTSEVQQASQVLCEKADAIFTPIDNTIATAMTVLAETAIKAKVPVYVGADSMVADNGFATVGIRYEDLGKETANITAKILKGTPAKEIPVKVFNTDLFTFINKQTADAIGVVIPEDIASSPTTVLMGAQDGAQ